MFNTNEMKDVKCNFFILETTWFSLIMPKSSIDIEEEYTHALNLEHL